MYYFSYIQVWVKLKPGCNWNSTHKFCIPKTVSTIFCLIFCRTHCHHKSQSWEDGRCIFSKMIFRTLRRGAGDIRTEQFLNLTVANPPNLRSLNIVMFIFLCKFYVFRGGCGFLKEVLNQTPLYYLTAHILEKTSPCSIRFDGSSPVLNQ